MEQQSTLADWNKALVWNPQQVTKYNKHIIDNQSKGRYMDSGSDWGIGKPSSNSSQIHYIFKFIPVNCIYLNLIWLKL